MGLGFVVWAVIGLRPTAPPLSQPVGAPLSSGEVVQEIADTPAQNAPVVLYPIAPTEGDHIGVITLPTLDLSWPIFAGTTDAQLDEGVGHFSGSVLPGIADNSVLSGHRTTVFGRLGELSMGDSIHVTTIGGSFTYKVREFRIVPKTDRTVIVPTETAVLTVTTCHPFHSPIPTTQAFVVSADLIHSDHTPHVFDTETRSWYPQPTTSPATTSD